MFTFLLVVQALIAATLVGVILMQQSEGGGLGMGGSPSGLMSARGAANFLTRATGILAVSFIGLSIALAVVATQRAAPSTIDTSLAKKPLPVAPAPAVPLSGDPAAQPGLPTTNTPAPTPAASNEPVVPLAAASPKTEAPKAAPKPASAAPKVAPKPAPATTDAAPKVVPTRPTLPTPVMSNNPTPAPTADDMKGN
jgi:preprotein translocase subunit SecG